VGAQDHLGHTPLHNAAQGNAKKKTAAVAVLLLVAGAASNVKALDGQVRGWQMPHEDERVAYHQCLTE
jgi:hypothetical protein